jgi:hypothetical protein
MTTYLLHLPGFAGKGATSPERKTFNRPARHNFDLAHHILNHSEAILGNLVKLPIENSKLEVSSTLRLRTSKDK